MLAPIFDAAQCALKIFERVYFAAALRISGTGYYSLYVPRFYKFFTMFAPDFIHVFSFDFYTCDSCAWFEFALTTSKTSFFDANVDQHGYFCVLLSLFSVE